jgi:hypothetical protein
VEIESVERRSGEDVRRILEALPDWFADADAIEGYVVAAEDGGLGSVLAGGSVARWSESP